MAATDKTEGEVQSTNPFVRNVRCLCWPERSYTRDALYLRLEDILWLRKQLTGLLRRIVGLARSSSSAGFRRFYRFLLFFFLPLLTVVYLELEETYVNFKCIPLMEGSKFSRAFGEFWKSVRLCSIFTFYNKPYNLLLHQLSLAFQLLPLNKDFQTFFIKIFKKSFHRFDIRSNYIKMFKKNRIWVAFQTNTTCGIQNVLN